MRYIPKKTKIKSELLPHVTWPDVIIGLVAAGIFILLFTSSFDNHYILSFAFLAR